MTNSKANPDDRRQYLRLKINALAELHLAESTVKSVMCNNLSAGGAQIQCEELFEIGAGFKFSLTPDHPKGQSLNANSVVIWRSSTTQGGKTHYRYGLRFLNVN